jgi:CheY-like chemotaxis protein
VLLVEDDKMNQVTIRRFIENNYSVIITPSSDEAMEIIKKGKVDIILMDITIKGSRNGLELTKELKVSKEFSHIPIIAVTAHAFESDRKNSLDAGCDSYISKPFTKDSLLNMIALYVHK